LTHKHKLMQLFQATILLFAVVLWWCDVVRAQSQHLRRVVPTKVVVSSTTSSGTSKIRSAATGGDGRIIYFQHIHKSGGSTMCRIATLNQMKTSLKTNCNVQPDQRCCGNGSDSAEALAAFAESTPFTFVANEGTKKETHCNEQWFVIAPKNSTHNKSCCGLQRRHV
jgi:hypothetical protein